MKKVMAGLVWCSILVTTQAFGTVYDYSTSGMDGTAFELQKYDAGFWDIYYSATSGPDWQNIAHRYSSSSRKNRGANVWSAPAGEYITQIDFSWRRMCVPDQWDQVIYSIAPGDSLTDTTPIVWDNPETYIGTASGTTSLSFTQGDNLQRVGLGFVTKTGCQQDWFEKFSDVVITTTPEPATIGLMMAGGLLLRRRNA